VTRWDLHPRADFELWFETTLSELGLSFERTTLKSLPPNVHWHIRRPGSKGVLEATWIRNGEAWLSVHSNRQAEWIHQMVELILTR